MSSSVIPPVFAAWLRSATSTDPAPRDARGRQALCLFGITQKWMTTACPKIVSKELAEWQEFDAYDETAWSRVADTTQIVVFRNVMVNDVWATRESIARALLDFHVVFLMGRTAADMQTQTFIAEALGMSAADSPFLCVRPVDVVRAANEDAAFTDQQQPEMIRTSPYTYVEASAAAARETGLLNRGVRADTLLRIVLASSRLRPLEQGPKRTVTSPVRSPSYCKWLEEAMGVDGSQPRRALCLFGQETHQLFVRWLPAALSHRYAQRQTLSTLDGDDLHWDSRIETDTKLVVVHNAAPSDVARSRRTVERILERAHVVVLFQETDAPPAFEADVGASCFYVVTPRDLGLGEDAQTVSASATAADVALLVRLGVCARTAEAVARAPKRSKQ
jgi:hypothetical protein